MMTRESCSRYEGTVLSYMSSSAMPSRRTTDVLSVVLLVSLLVLVPFSACSGPVGHGKLFLEGDIIFQTSMSSQSLAIQRATGSRYSHMGVILYRHGAPCVFEAVSTVRSTPVRDWIARGVGGHFVLKRLRSADRLLTPAAIDRLHSAAHLFEGRSYDLTFEWSDAKLYCSELVWKLYDRALGIRIGRLQLLREFHIDDPVVRKKMQERYGKQIPLDEPVISPASMFDAEQLTTVLAE